MNKWGKLKIGYRLRQKKVSNFCIKQGLDSIDQKEYKLCIVRFSRLKMQGLVSENNEVLKRKKVIQYLLQKGYEYDIILRLI